MEVRDFCRKVVHCIVEVVAKFEVCNVRWKIVHTTIELVAECEASDFGW